MTDPGMLSGLLFFHSILRWLILLSVAVAGGAALQGWLRGLPVIVWQRMVAIWAMVLCHVQLVLGLAIYAIRFEAYGRIGGQYMRFWKYEHAGAMVLAIALVTFGRLASKQARTERAKHMRVAIFYLLALLLMLAMTPWPTSAMGDGRGWL